MKHNATTEAILAERFGKDSLIALATVEDGAPSVRTVNAVYIDGAFYVVTHGLSGKIRQIAKDPAAAICGDWFTAHGVGENLGHVLREENRAVMEKLRAAFAAWYGNGHVDEADTNTCLLRIQLTDGVLFSHGTRYDVDFECECPEGRVIAEEEEKLQVFHGSAVPDLDELLPLSKLHNSDQRVVYLSSSIPYVLLYIWDAEKMGCSRKWVTGWLKDGIAYYEEQFPGQLEAFYSGVRGYVYSVLRSESMESVQQREDMLCSTSPLEVYRVTEIPDVYRELMRYEQEGRFRVLRFEEATAEKQAELIDRIAAYIRSDILPDQEGELACFMKRYFTQAWEKAKSSFE